MKMNATLLEKVEELTLYSIQLEKVNRDQQQVDQQQQERLQALEQKQAELERLLKQVLKQH